MRIILQRVARASVVVEGRTVGEIGRGLLGLVGLRDGDNLEDDGDYIVRKTADCRLFTGEDGRAWHASIRDLKLPVLLVSQFTLHADTTKSKPSFHRAMKTDEARALFDAVVDRFKTELQDPALVQTGEFGAMMEVSLVNDGPVTITIDSRNRGDKVPGEGAAPAAAAAAASGGAGKGGKGSSNGGSSSNGKKGKSAPASEPSTPAAPASASGDAASEPCTPGPQAAAPEAGAPAS